VGVLKAVGEAVGSFTVWTEYTRTTGCVDGGFALWVGAGRWPKGSAGGGGGRG